MSTDTSASPAAPATEPNAARDLAASTATGTSQATAPASIGRQLARLAISIALPTALYYVLHVAGLSNLTALSLAAILPSVSTVYSLVVRRRVDAISLVVLATIVLTVILSVVARDPRFLLARDGLITGLWGLWFFATLRARRPAAYLFARPLMEGRKWFGTRAWDPLWQTSAQFRRIWRFSTIVFGTGLLLDAVIRIVMAYLLPVSVVPALGSALWPITFVLIQAVTNVYYHRAGLYRILGASWAARRYPRE
ncbi:MAG TPA: VC0807 family protein [Streptosporangiaceae bacterium]|nr:VC0807 family protein [Streptosporangiaceae bacterium]